ISTAVTPEADGAPVSAFLRDGVAAGSLESDAAAGAEEAARERDVLMAIQPLKQGIHNGRHGRPG
ncbi:MAG TPA: hypothetical protein PLZ20_10710, partial [Nitrospira sp.]|nr:hypothetical protein [Nitrospira sp.]